MPAIVPPGRFGPVGHMPAHVAEIAARLRLGWKDSTPTRIGPRVSQVLPAASKCRCNHTNVTRPNRGKTENRDNRRTRALALFLKPQP